MIPEADCRVVLLGTGTPNADPDRSGPAVAVVSGGSSYLVDCGPGIVRRAAAAALAGITELEPSHLRRAFVTHLHSDHTAGLPDLLLTPWVLERTGALELYGPVGISHMAECVTSAWMTDIMGRLDGSEPVNRTGHAVDVTEIEPGEVYRDENVLIEAFPVRHGSFQSFGYRFTSAGRTVVVSGDTAPAESVIDASRGCDVLVHEVYSNQGLERREQAWRDYYSMHHTSASELARIAAESLPGLLVLYHQLYSGATDDELLEEVRSTYSGKVVSGRDLDVY